MIAKACPCCGKALGRNGLLVDYQYDTKRIPWYRYAAPGMRCRSCGAKLRAEVRRTVWPVLAALVVLFVALRIWIGNPPSGSTIPTFVRMLLAPAFALSVVCTFGMFVRYVRADQF